MGDVYISSRDVLPVLPLDIRSAAKFLYDRSLEADYDASQVVLKALKNLFTVKGKPKKLDAGAHILQVDVGSAIGQAKTDIDLGMASFQGAWSGRGASAFTNYVPVLTSAITGVQGSATATAAAITQFRSALQELWRDIVTRTVQAGAEVAAAITAVVNAGKKPGEAGPAVMGLVSAFAGWAADLVGALMTLDIERFKASDKLGEAEQLPNGLVKVSGPGGGKAAEKYVGPTGAQLPMPGEVAVDPDWSGRDIKDRWKPADDKVELDTQSMQKMINVFRDNGRHWNTALKRQIDASLNCLTPDAFGSAGAPFYRKVVKVMARDYILYLHSDERLQALANLLSKINAEYGAVDAHAGQVFREYITND